MNKTLLAVLGGCAALLLVCCVVSVVAVAVLDVPGQLRQLGIQLQGASDQTGVPLPPAPNAPSGSTSGNPFAGAATKAKNATKYRVEFTWTFGSTDSGKYVESPFLNMAGEVDGQNAHLTSKGGLLAMLAADQNATVELIEAGGKTYMKGVTFFGMADPMTWYIADEQSASSFKDFAKPDDYQNYLGGKDSDFKKVRSESLDGQSCDVWFYDYKAVQNSAIIGMLGSAKDKNEFGAIDKADMSVWLCGDGYVHKWLLDYAGHDTKDANNKGALRINAHTWDYNNPTISVTPPKDAKPMPGK